MQQIDGRFVYAASDLTNYLECVYLTHLDREVAQGLRAAPERDDPSTELLARKGDEHERRYLQALTQSGGEIAAFERPGHSLEAIEQAQRESIAAMERGDRIIYQATFFDGEFLGHPDFLRRIETPCARWPWSYEVIDTKLAINPKPYFIIQICNYSEQLARITGTMPQFASIVLGNGEERRYRLADYLPYYRRLKQRFLQAQQDAGVLYPHKVAHCKTCKWSATCQAIRENDDHLSQVAWIRRSQISRLNGAGILTVADLAAATDEQRPGGMTPQTFAK
ncbi:MAG TPA: TM0106 family RecB-like putative nuclease, partial [Candidatus Baltobacteraceae bacterium]|nr:TM0106 family RecB-like putative nuclease [Candidatus Baltobacteraceae bacterium]